MQISKSEPALAASRKRYLATRNIPLAAGAQVRRDGVSLHSLMKFVFPDHLENPDALGRLEVYAAFGPTDEDGGLRGGFAGMHRHTDQEINQMVKDNCCEAVYALFESAGKARGTVEVVAKTLHSAAMRQRTDTDKVRFLLAGLPMNEEGRYKFTDIQQVVLANQRRRLVALKSGVDSGVPLDVRVELRGIPEDLFSDTELRALCSGFARVISAGSRIEAACIVSKIGERGSLSLEPPESRRLNFTGAIGLRPGHMAGDIVRRGKTTQVREQLSRLMYYVKNPGDCLTPGCVRPGGHDEDCMDAKMNRLKEVNAAKSSANSLLSADKVSVCFGDLNVKAAQERCCKVLFSSSTTKELMQVTLQKKLGKKEEDMANSKRFNSYASLCGTLEQQSLGDSLRANVLMMRGPGDVDDRWDRYCALRRVGRSSYVSSRNAGRINVVMDEGLSNKHPGVSNLLSASASGSSASAQLAS